MIFNASYIIRGSCILGLTDTLAQSRFRGEAFDTAVVAHTAQTAQTAYTAYAAHTRSLVDDVSTPTTPTSEYDIVWCFAG